MNPAVIIVDEDQTFREHLVSLLQAKGLEVAAFEIPAAAIRFLQQQPWNWAPKLFITELVLKGMSGYAFMQRIAQLYPTKNLPTLVVTKLGTFNDRNEAELAGARAYLQKPVTDEKLLLAIHEILSPQKS